MFAVTKFLNVPEPKRNQSYNQKLSNKNEPFAPKEVVSIVGMFWPALCVTRYRA